LDRKERKNIFFGIAYCRCNFIVDKNVKKTLNKILNLKFNYCRFCCASVGAAAVALLPLPPLDGVGLHSQL
jgi:hypothetical protein